MQLKINGESHNIPEIWRDETLLTVIREHIGLTGTKFGCGHGDCGTCVIHLDGQALRSCQIPVSQAESAEITTIEGLADSAGRLHPVQNAWLEERVAQCGYCQSGQIMQAVALLAENQNPDDSQIADVMQNHLCRCGTQGRIRKAIHRAAESIINGSR